MKAHCDAIHVGTGGDKGLIPDLAAIVGEYARPRGTAFVAVDISSEAMTFDPVSQTDLNNLPSDFRPILFEYEDGVTTFNDLRLVLGVAEEKENALRFRTFFNSDDDPLMIGKYRFMSSVIPAAAWNGIIVAHSHYSPRNEGDPKVSSQINELIRSGRCTKAITGESQVIQQGYGCYTCELNLSSDLAICCSCAVNCHKGHKLTDIHDFEGGFFCDCGKSGAVCKTIASAVAIVD